jgi:phospholipase D
MQKIHCTGFLILLASLNLTACNHSPQTITTCDNATQIQACFSPGQNCTQILVDTINAAQHSIYVQAYSFTSYPIAKALVKASERGITVTIIVDKSDVDPSHYSVLPYLKQHNINLYVDDQVNIAHNKVMIFDENTLETGSFNFTRAAQRQNAENMLIIHNQALAEVYLNNWQKRLNLSQKL